MPLGTPHIHPNETHTPKKPNGYGCYFLKLNVYDIITGVIFEIGYGCISTGPEQAPHPSLYNSNYLGVPSLQTQVAVYGIFLTFLKLTPYFHGPPIQKKREVFLVKNAPHQVYIPRFMI